MDLHLSGKRVLITGASKGIGQATALLLAEEGCNLLLVSNDPSGLADTSSAIQNSRQVSVEVVEADLSIQTELQRVVQRAGDVDILVNNAGAIPAGDLLAIEDLSWRKAWDLKVFGYINLTRALLPGLRERQGVVVNVIGAAGEYCDPNYIAGSVGNAALMSFTRSLGKAAALHGMRVVGINPGAVSTERIEVLLRARAKREFGDEERWKEFYKGLPFGRPALPDEIANAVAFLASSRSGYTTGTILTIDGAPSGPVL